MSPHATFEVLFDDEVTSFADASVELVGNENLLSLANDYEDGEWRYGRFSNFIWDNAKEAALTQQEREALVGNPMTILERAAKRIRLSEDKGKGSEIAEILLYGIMRQHYKALPAVPKIFFKQNRNDNAKGADSVHIVVADDGATFELWLGEAKFYTNITSTNIEDFIESVEHLLGKTTITKENSIILGTRDVEDCLRQEFPEKASELYAKIKDVLSPETSLDAIKRILHIPILLIEECKITKECKIFDDIYRERIRRAHQERALEYFSRQIELLKGKINLYSEIKFHLILFPIPDKNKIVQDFLVKGNLFRGESD